MLQQVNGRVSLDELILVLEMIGVRELTEDAKREEKELMEKIRSRRATAIWKLPTGQNRTFIWHCAVCCCS